jgi:tetratricopeptide (TPR) repeat protein
MKNTIRFILVLTLLLSFKVAAQQYDEAKVYYNKGYDYLTAKNYNGAIDCFTEAIARRPDYAQAYCLRAWCYEKIDKYDRGLQDINNALTYYNGKDTKYRCDLYQTKADLYWDMKKYRDAEMNYIYALGDTENANEIVGYLFDAIVVLNSKVDSLNAEVDRLTVKTKQQK